MSRPHLTLDQVQFFERAMDAYESIKGTDAADGFFEPIKQAMIGKEVLIAQHKTCSRFLEKYLKECPVESLHSIFIAFNRHWEELSYDSSSSHAVEAIIKQCSQYISNSDFKPIFQELFTNLLQELRPVAAQLAEDRNGSHVIRCILNTLSPIKQLVNHVDKLARQIIQAEVNTPDRIRHPQFSAVLQEMIKIDNEKYPKLIKYLINSIPCGVDEASDRYASHMLEEVLRHGGEEPNQKIFDNVLKDLAPKIANNGSATYVLQRWLETTTNVDNAKIVLDQLYDNFEELCHRRPDVVLAMCSCASRFPQLQKRFMTELDIYANPYKRNKDFDKSLPRNSIAEACLKMHPTKPGALILQTIFSFQQKAADPLIGDLLKTSPERLKEICLDKDGTFVMTALFRSSLPRQPKHRMLKALKPVVGQLAGDRRGSYIVEDMFKAADMEHKIDLCEALVDVDGIKESAPAICRTLHLDEFVRRRTDWEYQVSQAAKREAAMNDLIAEINDGPSGAPPPPKDEGEEEPPKAEGGEKKRRRKHRSESKDE